MLTKGLIAKDLANFIKSQNNKKVEDPNIAIDNFCQEIEDKVFEAIKSSSITITIPIGLITVTGANGGGPVLCTNAAPIVLNAPLTTITIK